MLSTNYTNHTNHVEAGACSYPQQQFVKFV